MSRSDPSNEKATRRIVAFSFDSPLRAQEALLAALRLQESGMLELHDAVFISRSEVGAAHVTETTDPTPVAAAVPSTLLGGLIGAVIAGPLGFLIGGVLAGGTGALVAKLVDTGIPDRVIRQLRRQTRPGQCVVALAVSDIAAQAVVEELRRFQGAHVVYADLPPAALEVVRLALHEQA